jgi:hypothetical protein
MNVLLLLLTACLLPFLLFPLAVLDDNDTSWFAFIFLLAHQNPTNNFFLVQDEKKKKNLVSTGWR